MAENEKSVAAIISGTRDETGVMRGRDVREKLSAKADPAVVAVIATLAEINHGNVLHLASMASMLDQMTDMLQSFTDIAVNMKERTDQFARAMQSEVEGASTNDETSKH